MKHNRVEELPSKKTELYKREVVTPKKKWCFICCVLCRDVVCAPHYKHKYQWNNEKPIQLVSTPPKKEERKETYLA